jgi:hypothetical protein
MAAANCPLCTQKLTLAHADIKDWFGKVRGPFPNAHISWTFRDRDSQEQAFSDGRSKLHFPESAHNISDMNGDPCARAIDLFVLDEDGIGTWPPAFFSAVEAFNQTLQAPLMWGGLWKSLGDRDHWQLQQSPGPQ